MQVAEGEHTLFEGHPSWRSTLTFYIQGLFVALVGGALIAGTSHILNDEIATGLVTIATLGLLAVVLVTGYIKRMATVYTITNRRLHIKRGIIARRTQEARLERVQNVNTDQSALERVLRVGTVDFDTAGTDDHGFRFQGVADPTMVVERVDQAQREYAAEQGQAAPPRTDGL